MYDILIFNVFRILGEFIKPKEEDSDSSEEEKVIVLNADEKTKKNAKKRWKKI